jgi:hypothetical protein
MPMHNKFYTNLLLTDLLKQQQIIILHLVDEGVGKSFIGKGFKKLCGDAVLSKHARMRN